MKKCTFTGRVRENKRKNEVLLEMSFVECVFGVNWNLAQFCIA